MARKRKRKNKQKSSTSSLSNEEKAVNLRTNESDEYMCGAKILRRNELWRWDDLSDVKF